MKNNTKGRLMLLLIILAAAAIIIHLSRRQRDWEAIWQRNRAANRIQAQPASVSVSFENWLDEDAS